MFDTECWPGRIAPTRQAFEIDWCWLVAARIADLLPCRLDYRRPRHRPHTARPLGGWAPGWLSEVNNYNNFIYVALEVSVWQMGGRNIAVEWTINATYMQVADIAASCQRFQWRIASRQCGTGDWRPWWKRWFVYIMLHGACLPGWAGVRKLVYWQACVVGRLINAVTFCWQAAVTWLCVLKHSTCFDHFLQSQLRLAMEFLSVRIPPMMCLCTGHEEIWYSVGWCGFVWPTCTIL